ncbi:hypothetical protein [Jannaschia marina]|uniref:hypothetical protein n=1 Tax=Jannaschia marina TaxID=2741674 RepID=UPI0015CB006A|nr:hypothetical protein [Jannaschia marina]
MVRRLDGTIRNLMLGLAGTALVALAGTAEAQRTVRNTPGPAETPPASYAADTYVDSRGCVFLRAGVGGTTRWVPRVNRDRTVVCGRSPTARPATTTAAATTPAPRPAPAATSATVQTAEPVIRREPAPAAPREIAVPAPRRTAPAVSASAPGRPVAAAPRPARAAAPRPMRQTVTTTPRRTAIAVPAGCGASDLSARYLRNTPACAAALRGQAASAPAATATAAPRMATTPATPRRSTRAQATPRVVRVTPPATAVRVNPNAPSPNRATGAAQVTRGCAGASELSSRYLRGATRCGGDPNWSLERRSSVETTGTVTTASTRNARRTVLVPAARTTFSVQHPPAGYRAAFDDGRLNPHRGPRTLQGDYQSQAIWTNETPRRLRRVIYVSR